MTKVRWGLLSTANINRRLIPAMRASQRGELVAVASRSQAAAEAYAAQWEIPRAFGSYEAMLDSGQVDAVYISLPNHLHAEWAIRALRSGVHVLCEKPFALSLADVDAMIAAAQETGQVLAEAFMYRHHRQIKTAGEWVRSGRLGEVTVVNSIFNFSVYGGAKGLDNVRLSPEKGGGSLWDVGCYPVSLAQFLMGEAPQSVFGGQVIGRTGVDEVFCGQMRYSGGRTAQISCSFSTPFHMAAEVIGTAGRLVLNRPFLPGLDSEPYRLTFYPAASEPVQLPVEDGYLYNGEVEDMHDAILDGKPVYLTLAETRDHVRTILALYQSAVAGQVVTL
jgi:D-xylose 1-dehydrogenase (NADP+, D-xylono-1,5-lactone-forming)